MGLRKL